jgi:hypothetical protein
MLRLVQCRIWIQTFLRSDLAQARVVGRLHQQVRSRVRAGVIADQVKVLAVGRCDAEGLLDQTIGLVTVGVFVVVGHVSV